VFKTTEQSALLSAPSGAEGVQFWAHVEHELLFPWYYLQVAQDLGTEVVRTMLMLPSAAELADVVRARTELVWLEAAYIATPADVNNTGGWRLEPLVDVVIFRNEQNFPQGVSHTVDSGQVYSLGEPDSRHCAHSEKVFDAGVHLGKVEAA
jgi:hypothetical protein